MLICDNCKTFVDFSEANLERSNEYEHSRDATIRKVEELNALRTRFEEMTVAQQVASEKLAPANIQVITIYLFPYITDALTSYGNLLQGGGGHDTHIHHLVKNVNSLVTWTGITRPHITLDSESYSSIISCFATELHQVKTYLHANYLKVVI